MIKRVDAINIASELELPDVINSLVRGETLENNLDIFFGNAEEFFTLSEEVQMEYGQATVVPLWDDGNFDRLVGVYLPNRSFVDFSIEEPFGPDSLDGWNYQQILLPSMLRIVESNEYELGQGNELNRYQVATLFGFKYLKELCELEVKHSSNYDDYEKAIKDFRLALN